MFANEWGQREPSPPISESSRVPHRCIEETVFHVKYGPYPPRTLKQATGNKDEPAHEARPPCPRMKQEDLEIKCTKFETERQAECELRSSIKNLLDSLVDVLETAHFLVAYTELLVGDGPAAASTPLPKTVPTESSMARDSNLQASYKSLPNIDDFDVDVLKSVENQIGAAELTQVPQIDNSYLKKVVEKVEINIVDIKKLTESIEENIKRQKFVESKKAAQKTDEKKYGVKYDKSYEVFKDFEKKLSKVRNFIGNVIFVFASKIVHIEENESESASVREIPPDTFISVCFIICLNHAIQ